MTHLRTDNFAKVIKENYTIDVELYGDLVIINILTETTSSLATSNTKSLVNAVHCVTKKYFDVNAVHCVTKKYFDVNAVHCVTKKYFDFRTKDNDSLHWVLNIPEAVQYRFYDIKNVQSYQLYDFKRCAPDTSMLTKKDVEKYKNNKYYVPLCYDEETKQLYDSKGDVVWKCIEIHLELGDIDCSIEKALQIILANNNTIYDDIDYDNDYQCIHFRYVPKDYEEYVDLISVPKKTHSKILEKLGLRNG